MQLFSKNQKFIVEILEIRYIGHQVILLSNVFILLQFTQFKKNVFDKKKVPNMPGYYNIELFFVSRGAFTKCTLERKCHWIIFPLSLKA